MAIVIAIAMLATACTHTVSLTADAAWHSAYVNSSGRVLAVSVRKDHECRCSYRTECVRQYCNRRILPATEPVEIAIATDLAALTSSVAGLDPSLPASAQRSNIHDLSLDGALGSFVLAPGTTLFVKSEQTAALLRIRITQRQSSNN